jgi:hypothetical protein
MIKVTMTFAESDHEPETGNDYVLTYTEDGWSVEPDYPVIDNLEGMLVGEPEIQWSGFPSKGDTPSLVEGPEKLILQTINTYFPQWDFIANFNVEHDISFEMINPELIY